MAHGTKIEWTHIPGYKGETWNPVTGCIKVSDGCKYCYAERVFPRVYGKRQFSDVAYHPDRLDKPRGWKKPRAVFVNSLSDLYQDDVGLVQMLQIYKTMIECPQHIFIILTKRPENLLSVLENDLGTPEDLFPPHIWHGVSVENQKTADERIPLLLRIPSKVRVVSYEPALGRVGFIGMPGTKDFWDGHSLDPLRGVAVTKYPLSVDPSPPEKMQRIHWVIAGGESGPKARWSHPDWFRKMRDDCKAAGVPFFFKQWGEWGPSKLSKVQIPNNWRFTVLNAFGGGSQVMVRYGKQKTGDLLDGRQHHAFPEVVS